MVLKYDNEMKKDYDFNSRDIKCVLACEKQWEQEMKSHIGNRIGAFSSSTAFVNMSTMVNIEFTFNITNPSSNTTN